MKDPLLEEIDELITRAECLPSSDEEAAIFLRILQALRKFVERTNLLAIPDPPLKTCTHDPNTCQHPYTALAVCRRSEYCEWPRCGNPPRDSRP